MIGQAERPQVYFTNRLEFTATLRKFGNTYPNGPDLGTAISQLFRIQGVPETFIVDTNGVLRYVKIGPFLNVDEIRAMIDPLLP